ncbi:predicted protein [Nematostella vectensis]|uniref:NADH:ubiquinone oxidoreductase intermediate-associated protein 30 domain-containing protein n=2 Tax=Nematostella vectensis TaxID=45351 RepID=A7S7X8_NEMVE|nr:predicted protein [Nematostella vectensis]|eukprot:XP_001632262.1 predicted protein [Nematostella vectensis]
MLWDFKKKETMDKWVTITDKQFGGLSTAEFVPSKSGKAVFRGNLSTKLPKESEAKHTGVCAVRSQPQVDWKGRVVPYDTSEYDGIQMRIRGDGRTYALNIQPDSVRSDDLHQAFMYTRGGPYWETIRMPFSKFILTNSGYLQDHQMDIPRMRTFGITLADNNDGPFSLEIDYIKAVLYIYQPKHFQYQHDKSD